jgi:uncharacterized tellurite resistance protein B-like protein
MNLVLELQTEMLLDGKITDEEVGVLSEYLRDKGSLDIEDVKLLVELLCNAREVSPKFDEIFFPALKKVLLADGRISMNEQFYLLKMLYSDGKVRESEKQFLRELLTEVKEITPELKALCDEAFNAPESNWSVGGKK